MQQVRHILVCMLHHEHAIFTREFGFAVASSLSSCVILVVRKCLHLLPPTTQPPLLTRAHCQLCGDERPLPRPREGCRRPKKSGCSAPLDQVALHFVHLRWRRVFPQSRLLLPARSEGERGVMACRSVSSFSSPLLRGAGKKCSAIATDRAPPRKCGRIDTGSTENAAELLTCAFDQSLNDKATWKLYNVLGRLVSQESASEPPRCVDPMRFKTLLAPEIRDGPVLTDQWELVDRYSVPVSPPPFRRLACRTC